MGRRGDFEVYGTIRGYILTLTQEFSMQTPKKPWYLQWKSWGLYIMMGWSLWWKAGFLINNLGSLMKSSGFPCNKYIWPYLDILCCTLSVNITALNLNYVKLRIVISLTTTIYVCANLNNMFINLICNIDF